MRRGGIIRFFIFSSVLHFGIYQNINEAESLFTLYFTLCVFFSVYVNDHGVGSGFLSPFLFLRESHVGQGCFLTARNCNAITFHFHFRGDIGIEREENGVFFPIKYSA